MDFSSFTAAPRNQKKKTTYGKRTTTNHQAFAQFAESPQKPKAKPSTWSPSPSPEPPKVVTPVSKPAAGRLKRPSPKQTRDADMFDVPASDTEHSSSAETSARVNMNGAKPVAGKRKRDTDTAQAQTLQEKATAQARTDLKEKRAGQALRSKPDAPTALTKASANVAKDQARAAVKMQAAPNTADRPLVSRSVQPVVLIQSPARHLPSPPLIKEAGLRTLESANLSDSDGAVRSKRARSQSSGPQTPPPKSASPASIGSLTRSGSVTPRQHELWNKLLGRADGTDSPSRLAVDQLRITSASKNLTSQLFPRLASGDKVVAPARRGRLIDTLARDDARASEVADDDEDDSMTDNTSELDTSSEDLATAQHIETEVVTATTSQGPSRVTYGQVRSYMEDSGLEAELLMESPIVPIKQPPKSAHGSQSQGSHHAPTMSQDDDDDENESQGPMKSVHELRAKGESRRFIDDFENLLDDIQLRNSASWSRQRSGLMELCAKLADKHYVGRMVDAGLDERLLRACSDAADTTFNFVIAACIALIGSADVSLSVLRHIQHSECFEMLFTLLPMEADMKAIAKDRKSNMSKVAQGSFADFCTQLAASPLVGDDQITLSPHLMALTAIEAVLRRMRRLGHMDDLLDEQKTSVLLQILERRVNERAGSGKHHERGLELALSALEAGSVIPGRIQSAWTPKRMNRLAKLLPDMLDPKTANAESLVPLALRLMLNLTNGKATASTAFADSRLVQLLVTAINEHFAQLSAHIKSSPAAVDEDDEVAALDDRLILSLGAMINLAEFSDLARTSLLGTYLPLLHGLVDTFLENRAKAAEADSLALTASNVAYGYLAVLLGNLCENEGVKHAVGARLPDRNMRVLVEAIDEFVAYNKVADRSAYENEEGGKVWRVFTERLASVAEKLREPW